MSRRTTGWRRMSAVVAATTAVAAAAAVAVLLSACGSVLPPPTTIGTTTGSTQASFGSSTSTTTAPSTTTAAPVFARTVLGRSVLGRPIELFTAGTGTRRVVVIGGIHGDELGGEVARRLLEYLDRHPEDLPPHVVLEIIPSANPDGEKVGTRGNANGVDLNRNFPSVNWSATLTSGDTPAEGLTGGVSAGSEPETEALLSCLEDGCDLVISLHSVGGLIDFDGSGSEEIAEGMSVICGLPVRHMVHQQYVTGSLGIFVPERYQAPVITLELDDPELTPGLREALLFAAGYSSSSLLGEKVKYATTPDARMTQPATISARLTPLWTAA